MFMVIFVVVCMFVCLIVCFIHQYTSRKQYTISHEKHNLRNKDKTNVWIKWSTQGRATYV